ncbi:hypothetical protein [Tolypothrix sp. NIES-4075]|nr:hypothetical protein [Tolypothrix sp. NIES-4075]
MYPCLSNSRFGADAENCRFNQGSAIALGHQSTTGYQVLSIVAK